MAQSVGLLDHYNVSTRDLAATVKFYGEVLGLTPGFRPPMSIPGAWLYSEGRPVVHVNDMSDGVEHPVVPTGALDHVAFASSGFVEMEQHLNTIGVPYRTNKIVGVRVWQIFLRDPNGVLLELNYDVAKEGLA